MVNKKIANLNSANESMGRVGGANCGPTCSKAVSPWIQVNQLQGVHTRGESEDGKVWHRIRPVQGYM